ncbi:unnamed protein product [Rotaria sp. Silwood1]|nr:unnamed protein product [Rotaria sp. Silwood1]CAF4659520.1 unnamed protein product [Rotaria sp. Silwood1]
MLSDIALKLENAGADCVLIGCNTAHLIADELKQKIHIPLLHIAKETAKEIMHHKIRKVGLIGTKFTMENSFFTEHLAAAGIETIIPEMNDRDIIHDAILNEFSKGIFIEETKKKYLQIIDKLQQNGADAIIFGCTEISLLITQADCSLQIFDTTAIHAKAAADFALSN